MSVEIVSIPQVEMGLIIPSLLPLEAPDGINNGGYFLGYSPIDLLVAVWLVKHHNLKTSNLPWLFDKFTKQRTPLCYNHIKLAFLINDEIAFKSLSEIVDEIVYHNDNTLLSLMRKNAPLTFKWVKIEGGYGRD